MGIGSKLNKLQHMSAAEIRHRILEKWIRFQKRKAYAQGRAQKKRVSNPSQLSATLTRRAAEMIPGTDNENLDKLEQRFPDQFDLIRKRSVDRAKQILSGRFDLLGRKVDLTQPLNWRSDPGGSYRWERQFYADVQIYELPEGVDVKYIWELNRHQFIAELCRAWLFTQDKKFAHRSRELIIDWIDSNPLYEGVNWTSALEVAMRAISWQWALAATSQWEGWREEELTLIGQSLKEHAQYLHDHLSLYSSPYNHLVGEATALYLLGCWLRGIDKASNWEQVGLEVLVEHGSTQFYEDGFCVEQATGYHFFTLGFLVQAIITARKSGKHFRQLEQIVEKAFLAGAAFKQPDTCWPAIGDLDSARSIPVYPDDYWDFRGICAIGAVLFRSRELKAVAEIPGQEILWLFGVEGIEIWEDLKSEPQPPLHLLSESGYVIASKDRGDRSDWLLFDAGPLAHGVHSDATPSVAHGHNDLFQILFFQNGRPVLVDSGMPSYAGEREWVDYFRIAQAHNTLEVVGRPWVQVAGRLAWSNLSGTPELYANISRDVFLMRGYIRIGEHNRLERNILMLPGQGLWVADLIECDSPRSVRWNWQMPIDNEPALEENYSESCQFVFNGGIMATWSDNGALNPRVDISQKSKPEAWQAEGYGKPIKGARLVCESDPVLGILCLTFIGPKPIPAAVSVGGRSITSGASDSIGFLEKNVPSPAGIFWVVETDTLPLIVGAGTSGHPRSFPAKPLDGLGQWQAVITETNT